MTSTNKYKSCKMGPYKLYKWSQVKNNKKNGLLNEHPGPVLLKAPIFVELLDVSKNRDAPKPENPMNKFMIWGGGVPIIFGLTPLWAPCFQKAVVFVPESGNSWITPTNVPLWEIPI